MTGLWMLSKKVPAWRWPTGRTSERCTQTCACLYFGVLQRTGGRIFGSFPEQSSKVTCAYRGELLGLIWQHILFCCYSGEQVSSRDDRSCEHLLGLSWGTQKDHLTPGRQTTQCLQTFGHSKNIMINCLKLSFDFEYLHATAHQDDRLSYQQLPHPTQPNCCMDIKAKTVIWGLEKVKNSHRRTSSP